MNIKCLVNALFISLFLTLPSFAENFLEPDWSEFCPNKYVNINENRNYFTSTAKYWVERKKIFNKRIAECKNLNHELQGQCYRELRQIETNATKTHSDEIHASAINRASIWGW